MMKSQSLCKTVFQYNEQPISKEDMEKLLAVAVDYQAVKNHVYQRYGGIKSLDKIYPGYTVQKELGKSEFRNQLGLPSVYFNVAILDALTDIKKYWTKVKTKISKLVNQNENFSEDEKHYLRFLLKVNNAFEMVLNEKEIKLEPKIQGTYEELSAKVNTKKLNNYLRRKVRENHVKISARKADGFALTERAYRYADHGISITTKEKRQRVFIELTDNNSYNRQLYLKLFPETGDIKIYVPVETACKQHPDYINEVGLSLGMNTMLTTDEGHIYGALLGEYHFAFAEWKRQKNAVYVFRNNANSGRKKYLKQKHKQTEQIHSYINMELNRFIETEKPKTIYIPKLPPTQKLRGRKEINYSVSTWERGYIRKRLTQKCIEHSIEVIEVFGKDISNICSNCQSVGAKKDNVFHCSHCGLSIHIKENAARNAKNRGIKSDDLDKSIDFTEED